MPTDMRALRAQRQNVVRGIASTGPYAARPAVVGTPGLRPASSGYGGPPTAQTATPTATMPEIPTTPPSPSYADLLGGLASGGGATATGSTGSVGGTGSGATGRNVQVPGAGSGGSGLIYIEGRGWIRPDQLNWVQVRPHVWLPPEQARHVQAALAHRGNNTAPPTPQYGFGGTGPATGNPGAMPERNYPQVPGPPPTPPAIAAPGPRSFAPTPASLNGGMMGVPPIPGIPPAVGPFGPKGRDKHL